MKRIIISIILACATICSYAQSIATNSTVSTDIDKTINALECLGFQMMNDQCGIMMNDGTNRYVSLWEDNESIEKFNIFLTTEESNFRKIKNEYKRIERTLIREYGFPSTIQKNLKRIPKKGLSKDEYRNSENLYSTTWFFMEGKITLEFITREQTKAFLISFKPKKQYQELLALNSYGKE